MRCVTNHQTTINCRVTLPSSKSILNRLLVILYLSGNHSMDRIFSEASDVLTMQKLLLEIRRNRGKTKIDVEINTGNAGTVMRFLTSVLSLTPGRWMLTGDERMQNRPILPLTEALRSLGADIVFENIHGFPPLAINGHSNLTGGTLSPYAGISSQFISSLMMIGPLLKGGLIIELQGSIISGSYIRMTQSLMQKAGAEVSFDGNIIVIKEGKYNIPDFSTMTEPDWSAAAFWYELVSLAPQADIFLEGLCKNSIQGDSVLPAIYANLGVSSVFTKEGVHLTKSGSNSVTEFNYDFTECPDLAQPVIVSCAALGIKGCFSGIKTLRVKETDRITALKNELTNLGYGITVIGDEILLDGKIHSVHTKILQGKVNCYDDHRMAMSFAPLALKLGSICFDDIDVVKKSYPRYWKDIEMAGFSLSE